MKKIRLLVLFALSLSLFSCSDSSSQQDDLAYIEENSTVPDNAIKPEQLSKEGFIDKVMDYESNPDVWKFKGDLPCIIDFYADWCAPCKKVAPILEEIAQEYEGVITVYKVDTQRERELAAAFGIQSIPSFLFCPKDGDPQMSSGIGRSDEETKQMFRDYIDQILLKK